MKGKKKTENGCISAGTGFATCSIKESAADSDADLDVDGDDTLEYGKAQYTEADIIPCSGAGEDQGEAREREALRGAVLKYEGSAAQNFTFKLLAAPERHHSC